MTIARITAESVKRISFMDEYVEQFKTTVVDGNYSGARDAINKVLTIAKQCKQDLHALEHEKKLKEPDECGIPFPRHVKLGGIALRFTGNRTYFRDAGLWEVKANWKDGKLVCTTRRGPMAHVYGAELVECTSDEWHEQNQEYVGDKQIAWGPSDDEEESNIPF